uniref:uncharacterized protein LOC122587574 n=1 Tax=Erigeron canadensis TaxID=72917 RepID=UPI001CB938EF|nr:uncharacterized protein LOC122587574 [Erigeron canadensis]
METTITMLGTVTSRTRNTSVRVRVLHAWWQGVSGKDPMLELILGDEQGGRIAASIRGKWTDNFTITTNGTVQGHKFLPTAHKYKIVFSPTTIVRPIQDFTGSRHAFNFTSFTDIATNDKIKDNDCVDIIGRLCKMGDIVNFDRKGVESTRMVCYLEDLESVQIKLTLFGKFIELLTDEVSKQDQEQDRPVVIILQFGKINQYRENKGVANAFNGSKLFVNNDIDEIKAFVERYDGNGQVEQIEGCQSTIMNPDDFLKDCDHVTLADYMTHEPDGSYVTYATIDSIDADEPWWHSACKSCRRKVYKIKEAEKTETYVGNGLRCPGCGPNPKSLYPKFNDTSSVAADSETSLRSPTEKNSTTDSDNDPEVVECLMNKNRKVLRCTDL